MVHFDDAGESGAFRFGQGQQEPVPPGPGLVQGEHGAPGQVQGAPEPVDCLEARGTGHHEGLAEQGAPLQLRLEMFLAVDDQVQVVPQQGRQQIVGQGEIDLHPGVCRQEGLDVAHEDAAAELHRGPQPQPAGGPGLVQVLGRGLQGGEHLLAGQEQPVPMLGEPELPRPALHQLRAGVGLQLGDGVADGGLGEVQPPGGPGEAAGLAQGVERAQLIEIKLVRHTHELYSCRG